MITEAQARVVAEFKGLLPCSAPREIRAFDDAGAFVSVLRPVDRAAADDPALVSALTEWRLRHRENFLSVFTPTARRTRRWLAQSVLDAPDRVLFLITDERGDSLGHIGLSRIDGPSAEVDNVLRGVDTGSSRLMHFSHVALARWACEALGVEELFLRVFADNARAVASYARVGFRPVRVEPLIAVQVEPGETRYEPCPEGTTPNSERRLLTMVLDGTALSALGGGRQGFKAGAGG